MKNNQIFPDDCNLGSYQFTKANTWFGGEYMNFSKILKTTDFSVLETSLKHGGRWSLDDLIKAAQGRQETNGIHLSYNLTSTPNS